MVEKDFAQFKVHILSWAPPAFLEGGGGGGRQDRVQGHHLTAEYDYGRGGGGEGEGEGVINVINMHT